MKIIFYSHAIAHVRRYIKILTWLRGFLVIFLYSVWFSLCSSIFLELRENGVVLGSFKATTTTKATRTSKNYYPCAVFAPIAVWCRFLWHLLHDYDFKIPNASCCGGRNFLFSFFKTWMQSSRDWAWLNKRDEVLKNPNDCFFFSDFFRCLLSPPKVV